MTENKNTKMDFSISKSEGSKIYEEVYKKFGDKTHWETDGPTEELVELVKKIKPCPVLDIGCGTGKEAIFLAKEGYDSHGIDISPTAIKLAMKNAKEAKVNVNFQVGNVLALPYQDNSFGLVSDRGCFHLLNPTEREKFAEQVKRVLVKGGIYFMRCFNDKAPERETGPYHLSKKEITDVFSSYLNIVEIKPIVMHGRRDNPSYCCVMKKK